MCLLFYSHMSTDKPTIKQLRSQVVEINTKLNDLQMQGCPCTTQKGLSEIRSGRASRPSRLSIQKLEDRRDWLEFQLEEAERGRSVRRFLLVSILWVLLSIYTLVWLGATPHPFWALESAILISSTMALMSLMSSVVWLLVWVTG